MMENKISFTELVRRAKLGDKEAFGIIYETHLTPLYRYVYIRLGNREEADDITQEVFLKAYQAIDRFELTRENLLPYLFTIARNVLINRSQKKRSLTMPPEDLDREGGVDDTSLYAEREELKETLRGAIAILSESEREIIELRFFAERSYAEIAIILEKREDAIRQHVARAMKKMRAYMTPFK